ncbi:MAG: ATP-binding protein [Eubacteriales bacterium]
MITEILVSVFYIAISKENFENIVLKQITNLIAVTIHTLVMLLIIKGFSVYVSKRRLLEKLTIYDSLYICVIPICSIFLLCFLVQLSFHYRIRYSICILFCFLVIFINVFFFTIFDKLRLSEKLKYENALLRNQAEYFWRLEENANNTFEKVRQVKHDLKYQLLYLKSKTEENTSESLADVGTFLNTLIDDTLSDKMIEYTKNKSINRLLNYKLFSMRESNIELDIKVSIRDDAYIDEVSLYIILGNAIDNAVRNFDNYTSEMKSIVVRIIDDYDNLFIKVSNPYNKKLKFKNGLPVTDKQDKELHGIGLQSIKDLVEQKNGHFKITNTENVFTLEVLLYDEIKYKNSYQ